MEVRLRSIAVVRSSRAAVTDDDWDAESSRIDLDEDVPDEALLGLETFSHVQVITFADRATDVPPGPWHRRPRGRADWPDVGIFAQRNKDRPNRLLSTVTAIIAVEARSVVVRGLDAVDGTPVLDMKPVFRWSGPRGAVRAPAWSDELGEGYF